MPFPFISKVPSDKPGVKFRIENNPKIIQKLEINKTSSLNEMTVTVLLYLCTITVKGTKYLDTNYFFIVILLETSYR